jgi:hypothetical protein
LYQREIMNDMIVNDKKEIELKKIDASKEIAMLNNEAKLLVQGEYAKVQGLFKGLDMATQQINAQNAMQATPPAAPITQAGPQGAPPAPSMQQKVFGNILGDSGQVASTADAGMRETLIQPPVPQILVLHHHHPLLAMLCTDPAPLQGSRNCEKSKISREQLVQGGARGTQLVRPMPWGQCP